jgi:hypothetical protein
MAGEKRNGMINPHTEECLIVQSVVADGKSFLHKSSLLPL